MKPSITHQPAGHRAIRRRMLILALGVAGVAVGLSGCIVVPAYVGPPPVYVAPRPVYVAPAPVYGWYGWGYRGYWR